VRGSVKFGPVMVPAQWWYHHVTPDLELLATTFTDVISDAVKDSIPRSRKSLRSKPWWTPELRDPRKGLVKPYKDLFTSTNE
jgi:hypothetical protein